jgi:hypothetical protein
MAQPVPFFERSYGGSMTTTKKDLLLMQGLALCSPCDVCKKIVQPDSIVLIFFYQTDLLVMHYDCAVDGWDVPEMMRRARELFDAN